MPASGQSHPAVCIAALLTVRARLFAASAAVIFNPSLGPEKPRRPPAREMRNFLQPPTHMRAFRTKLSALAMGSQPGSVLLVSFHPDKRVYKFLFDDFFSLA
jgi:hypothetical protein